MLFRTTLALAAVAVAGCASAPPPRSDTSQAPPALAERDPLQRTFQSKDEAVAAMRAVAPRTPKAGDVAPDFTLASPDGATTVALSSFRGRRPVVLVFGSYT